MVKEETERRAKGHEQKNRGPNKKLSASWVVTLHSAYPEGLNNFTVSSMAMYIPFFPFLIGSFYCSYTGKRTWITRPRESYIFCGTQSKMKMWGPLFTK